MVGWLHARKQVFLATAGRHTIGGGWCSSGRGGCPQAGWQSGSEAPGLFCVVARVVGLAGSAGVEGVRDDGSARGRWDGGRRTHPERPGRCLRGRGMVQGPRIVGLYRGHFPMVVCIGFRGRFLGGWLFYGGGLAIVFSCQELWLSMATTHLRG